MDIFTRYESEIRGYCRANPVVFDRAENAEMFDEDGNRFIDFFACAGVLNYGHNNPKLKAAMLEYIQRNGITHSLDLFTKAKREFIETFVNTILKPRNMDYKLQFMSPTGTNAIEAALKLARKVTGRRQVVAFTNAFHGMSLGALAATGNNHFRQAAGVPLENVVHLPFETAPGGGIEQIKAYGKQLHDTSSGLEKPAAFLVEPIQAEGGVNVASKEWLHAVQALAKETEALFILDDIQAGCGRTGSFFSFEAFDLDPDIITLAKGIGGYGTALAMNLNKPEHDKHWLPGEHTGTFRGQDLSFVAGKASFSFYENDEFNNETLRKGNKLRAALEDIAKAYPEQVAAVRGRGMILGIDFGDGALVKKIADQCFKHRLIICPCGTGGRVVKLIPPLTIEDSVLDEGIALFRQAVDAAIAS
ncbi:diaminobutyrate--2-oxoglutarate transaminase [Suttonella sp. R2A3]|uniref:diaminobutyrate--2-oxoglutarate transaminase n=1 Tax=Suttonella sp. R2A3 TaxID=2908648 RepID=UPI0038FBF6F5